MVVRPARVRMRCRKPWRRLRRRTFGWYVLFMASQFNRGRGGEPLQIKEDPPPTQCERPSRAGDRRPTDLQRECPPGLDPTTPAHQSNNLRPTQVAKKRDRARNFDYAVLVAADVGRRAPSSGKSSGYLGDCCGYPSARSSTTMILAVLTRSRGYPILAQLTRECLHFPAVAG
jgi:hypothetical protein